MKINKLYIVGVIPFLFAGCVDLDTMPEGGTLTSDQKEEIVKENPTRLAAEIAGMTASVGKQGCVFPNRNPFRDDDAGYPTVCLSQDLNGADMVSDDSGYNWFSVSSGYDDRSETYANPYMRWAVFYNQLKLANDILEIIPEDTQNSLLLTYEGQAKATRAFDYLSLVPYFQFKYKGNEDKPSVPILTDRMTGDLTNNPRASLRDVYALIIKDLTAAIERLEGYRRVSKAEIDQQVAYGLRARANLYMENWEAAAADAEEAMKGYTPYSMNDINKPGFISANDPNWMWAIILNPINMPDPYPSWISVLGSFSADAYTCGVGCYKSINKLLYDKISSSDVRKGWWVDEKLHSPNLKDVTWGTAVGDSVARLKIANVKEAFLPYTNVKFGQYGYIGSDVNAGDWCMMRVEEMLLIQAEAVGMTDLNRGKQLLESFVKSYRDPDYTCTASDKESFQDAVWFQRRVELWGEGFAMADIMRLSKPVVRFHPGKESNFPDAFRFNLAPTDEWLLMRIPQAETNNNRGIPRSANNNGGALPEMEAGANLRDGVTD